MTLRFSGSLLALALLVSVACDNAEPGAGSNTNWLRPCESDADCGRALSCLCGVCSASCDGDCSDLPHAVCVASGSAQARQLCGDAVAPAGMCLPECAAERPCGAGQLCSDGSCLQLASLDDSQSGCVPGAQLAIDPARLPLEARYGTLFGDALYQPVAFDERPADWVEPLTPTPLIVSVTDPQGEAVAGCAVRFITGEGSGAAFADATTTDENGQVLAYWVAGDQREQLLEATLIDQQGRLATARLEATAYANDEGPQVSDGAPAPATRPSTLRLSYALPETARRVRVVLAADGYPHHAFYSALSRPGFFAGLQNTSDRDVPGSDVPDSERILIASVWNLPDGDAQQLFGIDGLDCGPHAQDLGGIRCTLSGAWQAGQAYAFELERTPLALGESAPGYAALGYVDEPCASSAGCTDYSVFFGAADAPEPPLRIVAYRYQSAVPSGDFGSFVQPYLELPAQTSCLSTPVYAARFQPFVQRGDSFEPLAQAEFSATYRSWANEVCANYAAEPEASGFRLVTGGPRPLGRPQLPDEPARALALPVP